MKPRKTLLRTLSLAFAAALVLSIGMVTAFALPATDKTPEPDVTISDDYVLPTTAGGIASGYAYASVTAPTDVREEPQSEWAAFWKYTVNDNGTINLEPSSTGASGTTLYLCPGKLLGVKESGARVVENGAFFVKLAIGSDAWEYPVQPATPSQGSWISAISHADDSTHVNASNVAVLVTGREDPDTHLELPDAYYVLTRSNGWAMAVAKVGDYYFSYKNHQTKYDADNALGFAGDAGDGSGDNDNDALWYANQHGEDIILLCDVELATTEWVHLGTGKRIYCCNDSHLTVANGGNLTIQNRVVDQFDSVPTTEADAGKIVFRLINGGTIKDEAGNTIYATYTKDGYAYASEKSDSKVYGKNTVLYFGDLDGAEENVYVGGSDSRTVSIRGTFARLAGFVWVLDDPNDPIKGATFVNATFDHDTEDGTIETGHAVVVGHEPQANLTIDSQSDGTLCHVRCAFGVQDGAPIYMKAGSLWVQPVKDNTTDVHVNGVTPFDGELNATIGNVYINGTMKSVTAIDEAVVQISGTAVNAKTIGGSSLYVKGNVTGTVTGEEKDGKSAALRVEKPTNAQGVFETISGNGVITMSGDLTVNDVSNTKEINGGTGNYALTLNGPEGKTFSNLTGSFRSISATDVDLILSGVVISKTLNGKNNEILLNDDTRIGGNSNASCAAGTLKDSVLYIEDGANPQVYIRLTGVGESEVYMDAKAAASNSKIGLEGTFKSVTGKAYVFGDLTINSTVEKTPVYGVDELVLIGGMSAYSDSGLSHKLTLTDAAGNASVKLASDRDGEKKEVSAGFRAILVEDIYTDSAVKLTMNETVEDNFAKTKAINIGNDLGAGDDRQWDINALEVVGDKNTEVELRTNNIFGKVNCVDIRAGENSDGQPTVKLTGTPDTE